MDQFLAAFNHDLDTAPLALLVWISGVMIEICPRLVFYSKKAVSTWSIIAIIVTGMLALQVNGYEYLLPWKAKVWMVVTALMFMLAAMIATFLARNEDVQEGGAKNG